MNAKQLNDLYSSYLSECENLGEDAYMLDEAEITIARNVISWCNGSGLLSVVYALIIGFELGMKKARKETKQ